MRPGDCVTIRPASTFSKSSAAHSASHSCAPTGSAHEAPYVNGVVHRVTETTLCVVLDGQSGLPSMDSGVPDFLVGSAGLQHVSIVRLANKTTYTRLQQALRDVREEITGSDKSKSSSSSPRLVRALMGLCEPTFDAESNDQLDSTNQEIIINNPKKKETSSESSSLNESQMAAIRSCLRAKDYALIHGPPGTGKTRTVVELIRKLSVEQGERVLVCASSNIAVDNIVERLAKLNTRAGNKMASILRVGHPARMLPSVLEYSIDTVLRTSEGGCIVAAIAAEIDGALVRIAKTKNRSEKSAIYAHVRDLRRDLREREKRLRHDALGRPAAIVLATLAGAAGGAVRAAAQAAPFDTVVIDECAQATEPECWIALRYATRRAVLAGDHLQLPPTVRANSGGGRGSPLERTLFERLAETQKHRLLGFLPSHRVVNLLTVQYRMHRDIMAYPSHAMYGGQLTAHKSVASHTLLDLPGVQRTSETESVLLLIDTVGASANNERSENDESGHSSSNDSRNGSRHLRNLLHSESKYNEGEADIVAAHVAGLCKSGLGAHQIAVLTPYNAQVAAIRARLAAMSLWDIEVGSVDGMQGREKDAIVISLVRSNDDGEIGFLSQERRLNVAITRAKRHLCVVCNSETMAESAFCKGLLEFMMENGDVSYAS